jgi:hypothetical protein
MIISKGFPHNNTKQKKGSQKWLPFFKNLL